MEDGSPPGYCPYAAGLGLCRPAVRAQRHTCRGSASGRDELALALDCGSLAPGVAGQRLTLDVDVRDDPVEHLGSHQALSPRRLTSAVHDRGRRIDDAGAGAERVDDRLWRRVAMDVPLARPVTSKTW